LKNKIEINNKKNIYFQNQTFKLSNQIKQYIKSEKAINNILKLKVEYNQRYIYKKQKEIFDT
jgi:hypothetical protein